MRQRLRTLPGAALALLAFLVTAAAPAVGGEATAFERITRHYESVRASLAADRLDGVADEARRIAAIASGLTDDFEAGVAGVEAADGATVHELLPAVVAAAERLAAASDLESARGAFGELSKPLVRYRTVVTGDKPEVAYCSMKKTAWLQPKGEELGNPYYGQSMVRCGEIVSR